MKLQIAIGGLLAAALPAAAQPPPQPTPAWTPWSVESPGPLGARFGLGVDLLLDGVDEAEVVAGRQTVRLIGEDGSPRTDVVPLDPGLVNRKHRQDWEERSFGFQVPVALPPFRLPGALQVEPSLVFEAAAVDGRLTFVDLVEGTPDRTLNGSGARWGVGVEALGELCRGCRWFWSAGYRYRSLGGLEVDGPAPADAAGLVTTERTEIDHDAHHLTARLGALVAGGRATAYLGVRRRQSDLVVEDETTLRFPQTRPDETVVATRLDLEADDTAALAGTDFRLGGGFVGRVEATFGGEGESVLVKVVRAHHGFGSPEERPRVVEARRRRAERLADSIAPAVGELRREFARRVQEIVDRAGPGQPLPAPPVLALLDWLEGELRRILAAPELLPVLSWFLELLERARADPPTGSPLPSRRVAGPPAARGPVFALLSIRQGPRRADAPPPISPRGWPASLLEVLVDLDRLFERADRRQLTKKLCITSEPLHARIKLWPNALREAEAEQSRTLRFSHVRSTKRPSLSEFYRGYYAYRAVHDDDRREFVCPSDDPSAMCSPVNLWRDEGSTLTCDFDQRLCELHDSALTSCGP